MERRGEKTVGFAPFCSVWGCSLLTPSSPQEHGNDIRFHLLPLVWLLLQLGFDDIRKKWRSTRKHERVVLSSFPTSSPKSIACGFICFHATSVHCFTVVNHPDGEVEKRENQIWFLFPKHFQQKAKQSESQMRLEGWKIDNRVWICFSLFCVSERQDESGRLNRLSVTSRVFFGSVKDFLRNWQERPALSRSQVESYFASYA